MFFLSIFNWYCILVQCFVFLGGLVDIELDERVMLERVEMIARLTTEGICRERDREIALDLIAEIAKGNLMKNTSHSMLFSLEQIDN